ncbi:MAG: hypothetical protein IPK25_11005 [Saprospiraceae bacterium]|nr:hypothetical protein [Saprospiraceae bacterium]
MRLFISIIFLVFHGHLQAQQQTFTLFNGVQFNGSVQSVTSDSVSIQTEDGNIVTFAHTQLSLKSTETRAQTLVLQKPGKMNFKLDLGLGFGDNGDGLISGIGIYGHLLYRIGKKRLQHFTLNTGIESFKSNINIMSVPVSMGYQISLFQKSKSAFLISAAGGYSFASVGKSDYEWEKRSSEGGIRTELGLTYSKALNNGTAFHFGPSFIYQEMSYTIENSGWLTTKFDMALRRLFFNIGIIF